MSHRLALIWLLFISATSIALADPLAPVADPASQLDYAKDVKPLLEKFCHDCHAGKDPVGKMQMDHLDPQGGRKVRKEWQKIRDNLHATLMPPDDAEEKPSPDERKKLVAWLDSNPLRIDCANSSYPGRVTIRRLNRTEYNNTIRDLCGVDFKPADDFPSDDVGYGFDNIGDVLSLPPLLLEKYMDAAEKITAKAIVSFDESSAPVNRKEGKNFASSGEAAIEMDFTHTGEYIFRVRASADQAGPELAKMAFRMDGKDVKTVEVKGKNAGDFANYEEKGRITKGKHRLAAAFLNDYYKPDDPDPTQRDRNLHIEYLEVVGPIGVRPEELPESHKRIIFVEPKGGKSGEECAEQILKRLASRAYRRPAKDEEAKRLVQLFKLAKENGESFESAIRIGVQAILVSPHFLFRIEQEPGPSDANGVRTLSEYELATRLSYFLWSSMPDNDLLLLAHQGKLRENLDVQVRRMIKDPKSRALVENFAGQWLQLRSLSNVSPDPKQFPNWDNELRDSMRKETETLFAHVMNEDRSILEFLDADYSFMNEKLAKHYGIEGVSGAEFRRVSLPLDQRGGLLGHASILTVTSNPNRTSPVKRGKWILENLLASPPPPAPPNVPQLDEAQQTAENSSLRQRLEMHRANASCAACHRLLDPPGFGLENYNAIGGWRTQDGKFPVDPKGEMPSGETFSTPRELRALLLKRENEFRRCLSEKLLTYALGRGLELDDECAVRALANEVGQNGNRFSALVLGIVHTDQFQKRGATRSPVE